MRSGKTATRKVIGARAIGRKPPRQRPSRTATTARCERRGRVLHTDRSRCRGDTSGLSGGSLEGDPRHAGESGQPEELGGAREGSRPRAYAYLRSAPLSANMDETVAPWEFSVEGEAGLESDERSGAARGWPSDRGRGEGDAATVHGGVQAEDRPGGRWV